MASNPLPSVHFSLRDVAPANRIDRWHQTLETIGSATDFCNIDQNFHAEFTLRSTDTLTIGDYRTSRADVFRRPRNIARHEVDGFLIFQQVGSHGSYFHGGSQERTFLASGDLAIVDADRPFSSCNPNPFHHRVTVIPRRKVRAARHVMSQLEDGLVLRAGQGPARLINAFLGETFDCAGDLSSGSADGVMDAAAGLLAAAAGGQDEEAAGAGDLALIHRRIRRRLRDPLVTPTRIAAECGMSLRKLHGLFEGSGDTFGSFLRSARLDLAHATLGDADAHIAIGDLAVDLGFNSLSTFYRVYRDAFGETPGDTRDAAGRSLSTL